MVVSDGCATYIHQPDRTSDGQTNLLTSPYIQKPIEFKMVQAKHNQIRLREIFSPKTVFQVEIRKFKV